MKDRYRGPHFISSEGPFWTAVRQVKRTMKRTHNIPPRSRPRKQDFAPKRRGKVAQGQLAQQRRPGLSGATQSNYGTLQGVRRKEIE